jgi:hypothetical protein
VVLILLNLVDEQAYVEEAFYAVDHGDEYVQEFLIECLEGNPVLARFLVKSLLHF